MARPAPSGGSSGATGSDLSEIANARCGVIKLSNAVLRSEICEAWADRVRWAKVCFDEGRMEECQRAIEDANAYAS